MGRYNIITKNDVILHQKNCPLLITSSAITYDNKMERVLAQIKFKNLSNQEIKAVYIKINSKGIDEEYLNSKTEYVYLDLKVNPYEYFGSEIPVYLKNNNTRLIEVQCSKIIFENNEVWADLNDNYFSEILVTKAIELDDPQILDELKIELEEFGINAGVLVQSYVEDDVRLCNCGNFNLTENVTCFSCGKTQEWWENIVNIDNLKQNKDERDKKSEIIHEELKKRRKKKIAICIFTGILIILACIMIYFNTRGNQFSKYTKYLGKSIDVLPDNFEYEEIDEDCCFMVDEENCHVIENESGQLSYVYAVERVEEYNAKEKEIFIAYWTSNDVSKDAKIDFMNLFEDIYGKYDEKTIEDPADFSWLEDGEKWQTYYWRDRKGVDVEIVFQMKDDETQDIEIYWTKTKK